MDERHAIELLSQNISTLDNLALSILQRQGWGLVLHETLLTL